MNYNSKTLGLSERTFRLVLSAVMIGLATVLSLIPFFKMPFGGSATLCSMLPILLIAYRYGPKWGLLTGFVYALIQLLLDVGAMLAWGLTVQALVGSFILDYIAAFTILGLAGIYGKGFAKYLLGMTTVVILRFVFHVTSGMIFFSSYAYAENLPNIIKNNVLLYSVVYNGAYLLPDLILCLIVGAIIYKPLKKYIEA